MSRAILFDDFVPGAVLGAATQVCEPALAECWQRIYGSDPALGANGAAEAASLAVVMMMRAYFEVVTPRPPGNIHARQRLTLDGLPRAGESIRTVVSCRARELRRERRHVELALDGRGDGGRAIYRGIITLIWAA